jgi:hypothetical protein
MEADMKKICEGGLEKGRCVATWMDVMRQVFVQINKKATLLDEVAPSFRKEPNLKRASAGTLEFFLARRYVM